MEFLERLAKERIVEGVDTETFEYFTTKVDHPRLTFGDETVLINDHDCKMIVYPIYVYDGDTLIGTFKYGHKTYKGNVSNMQAFIRAKGTSA